MANGLGLKPRLTLINLLCRICGQEDKNCIPMFSESGKKQGIQKKICSCLPLVVDEADTMPKQICLPCLHKLDATWEFRMLCKDGEMAIIEKLNTLSVLETEEQSTIPIKTIDETVKLLCENNTVTFGSAVIVLDPSSPSPPPKINPPEGASVTTPHVVVPSADPMMGVIPTQNMMATSAPITYMQPTVPAPIAQPPVQDPIRAKEDVYPQSPMQSRKQGASQRNERLQAPGQSPMPVPKRSVPAIKPVPPTRQSLPSMPRRRALREGDSGNVPPPKRSHQVCKFCHKIFPDDIIDHHVSLHLRQSFHTCLDCNKNFRSEQAMSRHRCGVNDPINLDPDDEPICL